MEFAANIAWVLGYTIPVSLLLLAANVLPFLRRWLRVRQGILAMPEPEPGHWLWGHIKTFSNRLGARERRQRWMKKCQRLYRTNLSFLFPTVMLVNAETASVLLKSPAPKDPVVYGFLKAWLGNGLLLSNGAQWARDRRLLTHCFHFDILRSYVEVYLDSCSVMLHKWSEAYAKGESVDVTQTCTQLTLDIILRCAMGFESNCQLETDPNTSKAAKYANSVLSVALLVETRLLNLFHHNDFLYSMSANGRLYAEHLAVVHGMSQLLIAERKEALREELSGREGEPLQRYRDFLDVLVTVKDEDGKGLTDEEIREQVDTFLFRGHDTTASALQWTIHYLSLHEEVQEKCRREVQSVLQKSGRTVETMTHADLNEMTYLTQTLKESLRLSAPVPFITRELTENTQIDEHVLQPGTRVGVPFLDVHTNPQQWSEPEKFDPDRFSLERSKDRHPYAFVPFSAGPRNCIGQSMAMDEMKTVLASVIARFRMSRDLTAPEPVWRPQLVSRAHFGIKVRLEEVH